ncbi:hypothetical protein Tco_0394549, partial [Tanacetum coccineum]
VKMDNPNITIDEYIELEAEKARRHGQTFNWENAMYGKVRYCEDIDYFKDFEIDFPAIVFNDHLATNHKILSEPAQSDSGIDANVDTQYHEFDEDFETNHDTPGTLEIIDLGISIPRPQ